ncbi:probable glycosidase CRH1 [Orbicella faveolata]|uniref:probable glycosidase CRH1 n=1 Tax=Orbicella faveolata TaxID=48498 RepID=UPI0009E40FA0|nr:probable glycosidase CRH1 [Orbicella faveolata]
MELVKFAVFTTIICPLLVIQQQARAAPVCNDLNSKCSDYDASYCKYDNIKQQCPLTCNQCGAIHPSSPVTSMTSSHLIDATQSRAVVLQSLTATESTVSTSQVTSVSQSLVPTQSTVSTSQATSVSQSLTPTQSTASISLILNQKPSSVDLSQGVLKSPPTQNTEMLRSNSTGLNNIKTQKFDKASASKTKLTQANLLITLGISWSYLMYWC